MLVVALRKESVDRNRAGLVTGCKHIRSLSARRAWIEIIHRGPYHFYLGSLSARRAWIEIEYTLYCPPFGEVALRKESVDRNGPNRYRNKGKCVALRKESVDRN